MLRASSITQGASVDVRGVLDPSRLPTGVVAEAELTALAEAALGTEPAQLEAARAAVLATLGPAALVDAACIIGNFERMNRIADACGIALGQLEFIGEAVRRELDIEHFASAANTRDRRGPQRWLGRLRTWLAMRRLAAHVQAAAKDD